MSLLSGTVQQYVATVCGDLNLDPKVWMTPITKKIYALLQEATEVGRKGSVFIH